MGLKNWINRRKQEREKQQRFSELSEEELQDLRSCEKFAYLEVAKKQVIYRGKINAYKDFPVNESDKQEIDMKDDFVKEMDDKLNEINEVSELNNIREIEAPKAPEINKMRRKHVYQTIKQM